MSITLATSLGNVTLKEQWDSYEKGVARDKGPWVKKVYLLEDWSYSDAVCNALMGGSSATTVGGPILRTSPHICVESSNLICLNATCRGLGEVDARDSGRPRFRGAIITADYGVPQGRETEAAGDVYNNVANNQFPSESTPGQPQTYMTQSFDFGEEVIKLPGSAYKFSTAPQLRVDVPVSMTIAVATITITREDVPYLPWSLIKSKLNRLNDRVFLGEAVGTIKFKGGRARRTVLSDGTRAQNLELIFKYREFDWNKQHRPDESSFDSIVDNSGNKPYVYADLGALFR